MRQKVVLILSPEHLKAARDDLEEYRMPLGDRVARTLFSDQANSSGHHLVVTARETSPSGRLGRLRFFDDARLRSDGIRRASINSQELSALVRKLLADGGNWWAVLVLDDVSEQAPEWRCIVHPTDVDPAEVLIQFVPVESRNVVIQEFDHRRGSVALFDDPVVVEKIVEHYGKSDPDLFALPARTFLSSPSVVGLLLRRMYELSPNQVARFVGVATAIAQQLRSFLDDDRSPVQIKRMVGTQLDTWAEWQGKRIGFVDGGLGAVGLDLPIPVAATVRVGSYVVEPGNECLEGDRAREHFFQCSWLVSDVAEIRDEPAGETISREQLVQASRILLELLAAVEGAGSHKLALQLLHGPLVSKYNQYDDERPNNIPRMRRDFLCEHGIDEAEALVGKCPLPRGDPSAERLWDHFMAVYGAVARRAFTCGVPILGVVERSTSRIVMNGLLEHLLSHGRHLIEHRTKEKIAEKAEEFGIDDSLLFGCLLGDGEYLSPPFQVLVANPSHARQRWADVVREYPLPYVSILKPGAGSPPYRVEANETAKSAFDDIVRLLYHSSTLVPGYGFPVGFSVVDRYARVPRWATGATTDLLVYRVLNRLIKEGKAMEFVVARRVLANMGRSFFRRPV